MYLISTPVYYVFLNTYFTDLQIKLIFYVYHDNNKSFWYEWYSSKSSQSAIHDTLT